MKKLIFLLFLWQNLQSKSFAQPDTYCGIFDAFHRINQVYSYDYLGRINTNFPELSTGPITQGPPDNVTLLYNCFYRIDETNGNFVDVYGVCTSGPTNSVYGEEFIGWYTVGYDPSPYYRRVNFWCHQNYICPNINQHVPATNSNNSSSNWSSPATWIDNVIPSASEPTILVNKTTTLDVNLSSYGQFLVSNTGSFIVASGVTLTNPNILVRTNGLLQNNGTLTGIGKIIGSLTNNGIIAPGNSPGAFNISNNYTATPNAIHNIEIAGINSNDTVKIGGELGSTGSVATLSGTLNVLLLNGFIPSLGTAYKIFTFSSSIGSFTNINYPDLPLGLSWDIQYNTSDVTLQVIASNLPIKLLSFQAILQNGNNSSLQWQIAKAEEGSNYELQRSTDNRNFASINVQHGNSSVRQFQYTDHSLPNGSFYYRLKMTDKDGSISYSNTALIKVGSNEASFAVYPNPVKRGESLQLNLQNNVAVKMEMINAVGQVVYSSKVKLTGSAGWPVPSFMAAGQYILRVTTENKVITQKLIIQ